MTAQLTVQRKTQVARPQGAGYLIQEELIAGGEAGMGLHGAGRMLNKVKDVIKSHMAHGADG